MAEKRTGPCGAYPACACRKVEQVTPKRGEWLYCTCRHTVGVHHLEETEAPK